MSREGEAIGRHVRAFTVGRWINGATAKADRPTLAEVVAEGYAVVRGDRYRALLNIADLAEQVDAECGVTHAGLERALDRLREVTT